MSELIKMISRDYRILKALVAESEKRGLDIDGFGEIGNITDILQYYKIGRGTGIRSFRATLEHLQALRFITPIGKKMGRFGIRATQHYRVDTQLYYASTFLVKSRKFTKSEKTHFTLVELHDKLEAQRIELSNQILRCMQIRNRITIKLSQLEDERSLLFRIQEEWELFSSAIAS